MKRTAALAAALLATVFGITAAAPAQAIQPSRKCGHSMVVDLTWGKRDGLLIAKPTVTYDNCDGKMSFIGVKMSGGANVYSNSTWYAFNLKKKGTVKARFVFTPEGMYPDDGNSVLDGQPDQLVSCTKTYEGKTIKRQFYNAGAIAYDAGKNSLLLIGTPTVDCGQKTHGDANNQYE